MSFVDQFGFWAIVAVLVWQWAPFMMLIILAGLQSQPTDILEAARMDGASLRSEIFYVLTPMAIPGMASTVLLCIILAWNEAFWTLNLTSANAAPLTAFIASYSSPEGLFYAKLSAASTMVKKFFTVEELVKVSMSTAPLSSSARNSSLRPFGGIF